MCIRDSSYTCDCCCKKNVITSEGLRASAALSAALVKLHSFIVRCCFFSFYSVMCVFMRPVRRNLYNTFYFIPRTVLNCFTAVDFNRSAHKFSSIYNGKSKFATIVGHTVSTPRDSFCPDIARSLSEPIKTKQNKTAI